MRGMHEEPLCGYENTIVYEGSIAARMAVTATKALRSTASSHREYFYSHTEFTESTEEPQVALPSGVLI